MPGRAQDLLCSGGPTLPGPLLGRLGCGSVCGFPPAPFPENHKSERRRRGLGKGLGLKGQELQCVCVLVLGPVPGGPCLAPGAHIRSVERMFVLGALDYPATAENRFHPPISLSLLGPTPRPHPLVPTRPYPTPPRPGPGLAGLQPALGCLRGLPVALPSVPHICVVDAVSVCLLIQEIEHVLDGQGERAAPVHSAEQGLKQVIHELLQGALGEGRWERVRWGRGAGSRRTGRMVPCLE